MFIESGRASARPVFFVTMLSLFQHIGNSRNNPVRVTKTVMKKFKHAIDGKDQGAKKQPRSLMEAMGFGSRDRYQTHDMAEYETSLRGMNMVDLQKHAMDVGIRPNCERGALIEKLKKEFRKTNSSYIGAVAKQKGRDMDDEKRAKALKIMSSGK